MTRNLSTIVLGILLLVQASFATYYVGVVRGIAATARAELAALGQLGR
jgi:hypothetical protein